MKTADIEMAVAKTFGIRKNVVVPRVSWGLGVHECDILVLSSSNYASEIEIKISVGDLRKDAKKSHAHVSDRIKYLYFAIPEAMEKHIDLIPERAGILIISEFNGKLDTTVKRNPQPNLKAKALTLNDRTKLMYLAYLRYWNYRFNNNPNIEEDENLHWNPDYLQNEGSVTDVS